MTQSIIQIFAAHSDKSLQVPIGKSEILFNVIDRTSYMQKQTLFIRKTVQNQNHIPSPGALMVRLRRLFSS